MVTALFVIGWLTIAGGIILGIVSGSFWGFVFAFASGAIASLIYFALAKILDNQASINYAIQNLQQQSKSILPKQKCEKCAKEFDGTLHSCPHCGYNASFERKNFDCRNFFLPICISTK